MMGPIMDLHFVRAACYGTRNSHLPNIPNERHDGVCASCQRNVSYHAQFLRPLSNLRWCSLAVTNSATVVCKTPMFLEAAC